MLFHFYSSLESTQKNGSQNYIIFVNYTKLQPDIQEKCYLQPELHITLIRTINNECSNYIGTSEVIIYFNYIFRIVYP